MIDRVTNIASALPPDRPAPVIQSHDDGVRALWTAVVDRAVRDIRATEHRALHRTPEGKLRRDALRFLRSNWGAEVMEFIGLDAGAVRERIG